VSPCTHPILVVFVLLASPAFAVELFRYRGAAKDGGTLEYVFEACEQNSATPVPFWRVCFSDTVTGPLRELFFVVVLPDGTVVEPSVARAL
jgi:hypothetical protein